jgi:hypothetical protein
MTIAGGILLIAIGAILKFATNIHVQGVSLDTVGVILMIAGAAGLVLGFFQEMVWNDRRRENRQVEAQRVEEERAAQEQRAVTPPRY